MIDMLNNDSYQNFGRTKSQDARELAEANAAAKAFNTNDKPLMASSKQLELSPFAKAAKERGNYLYRTHESHKKLPTHEDYLGIKTLRSEISPYKTQMLQSRIRTEVNEDFRRRTANDRRSIMRNGQKDRVFSSRVIDEYGDDRPRYKTNAIEFVNDMYSNINRVLSHRSSVKI